MPGNEAGSQASKAVIAKTMGSGAGGGVRLGIGRRTQEGGKGVENQEAAQRLIFHGREWWE